MTTLSGILEAGKELLGGAKDILDTAAEFKKSPGGQLLGQITSTLIGRGASKDAAAQQIQGLLEARQITAEQAEQAKSEINQFFSQSQEQIQAGQVAAEQKLIGQTFKGLQLQDVAQQQAGQALTGGFAGARGELTGAEALARGDIRGGAEQAAQEFQQARAGGIAPLTGFADPGQAAFQEQAALTGALGPEAEAAAIARFQESPGQQFQREQAALATLNAASAIGGTRGGNVRRELQRQAIGISSQNLGQRIAQLGQQAQLGLGAAGGISGVETGIGGALAASRQRAGETLGGAAERFGFGRGGLTAQEAQLQAGLAERTGARKTGLEVGLGTQQAGIAERSALQQAAALQQQGLSLAQISSMTGISLAELASSLGTIEAAGTLGGAGATQAGIEGVFGIGTGEGATTTPAGTGTGTGSFDLSAAGKGAITGGTAFGVPGAIAGGIAGGFGLLDGGNEAAAADFSGGFEFGGAFGGEDDLGGFGF